MNENDKKIIRNIRPKPRFNSIEWKKVENNAKVLKMPVTTYIRYAAVNIDIPKPIPILLNETLFEFKKQGLNLNQIAHQLNVNETMFYYLKSEYQGVIKALNETKKVYQEVGEYWQELIKKI
jgi:prephenate dehydratase